MEGRGLGVRAYFRGTNVGLLIYIYIFGFWTDFFGLASRKV